MQHIQQRKRQSIKEKEGAKYAAKKYLPPPSKMLGVTFHYFFQSESESSPEEIQHVNCLRLIQRLQILAPKFDENEKCLSEETRQLFQNLQAQFLQSDDSSEE